MRNLLYFSLTFCSLVIGSHLLACADDWPQWRGVHRDGVWKEDGLVTKFNAKRLQPVWQVPIEAGYSGPTVAEGRVYISDRIVEPEQRERIHCFDEKTGESLWSVEYLCPYTISYTAGPRACITIDGGKAYALGAMGHLHCLDATNGTVLWKRDLNQDYAIRMPIWGIAAAPLIYQNLVILQIGGKDACMVALNKQSGKEVWTSLQDRASYAAPVITRQAGQDVLACWTGDSVAGLQPLSGKVHWRIAFPPKNMPIGIATPVLHRNELFVTSFYDGSLMLKLSDDKVAAETMWQAVGRSERDTDALQSIISTPVRLGDHIYGVDSYGELRCLEAKTGKRIWEDLTAVPKARWANIHFVQNGDRTWMFNERGELIIGKLSPAGFDEIDRTQLIDPTRTQLARRDGVCWAHPAYANRHVIVRNDKVLARFNLSAKSP
ncbi:MAG TPA: dehydrogenase [Planctomycetaceae bacterium]|nr:dehydrogenase [Blastopirellula sp.]HAY78373.1 dehydrogenase [Planctomycetaceae bacterium]